MQEIIKKAVERYGLKYDEKQENLKVELEDGTVKEITKEGLEKALNNMHFNEI